MSTLVRELDPKGPGAELKARLDAEGTFAAHMNPNAAWAVKGEGVTVCLYRSGKLVVQGKGAGLFAERYLPEAGPALEELTGDLIGTDESGKGDYFGPLVVAAVLVPKGQERVLEELGVRDSKAVADKAAERIDQLIRASYPHEIVLIGPTRYNELYEDFDNLNKLLAWATAKAIQGIVTEHPCRNVLSDKFGNERLIAGALAKLGVDVHLTQKVRAESNPAVAAASIVARAAFLSSLGRLGKRGGTKLPKGAGDPVLPVARRIYREGGLEELGKVAKLHFKTTARITSELF